MLIMGEVYLVKHYGKQSELKLFQSVLTAVKPLYSLEKYSKLKFILIEVEPYLRNIHP